MSSLFSSSATAAQLEVGEKREHRHPSSAEALPLPQEADDTANGRLKLGGSFVAKIRIRTDAAEDAAVRGGVGATFWPSSSKANVTVAVPTAPANDKMRNHKRDVELWPQPQHTEEAQTGGS